jgi:hypothetical protein
LVVANVRAPAMAAAVFAAALAGFAAAQSNDLPKSSREAAWAWSEEGLQPRSVQGLDTVYVRPGVNFAEYRRVLLKPVSVAFRRGYLMTPLPGSRDRISKADAQKVRDRLALVVQEEVAKELVSGGYKFANEPGDDVLEVDMSIVDLFVAAPDVRNSVHVNTYAISAGEMSLVMELRDSASGEVLARAFDHSTATDSTWAHQITNVENEAEARRMASNWAHALRLGLDRARTAH